MVMPALLIKMSSLPCCSMTSLTTRRQSSADATLPRWVVTGVGKRSAKSAANSLGLPRLAAVPAAMTAPSAARHSEIAAPMPRVPPVTRATRPRSRPPVSAVDGRVSDSVRGHVLPSWSGIRALLEESGGAEDEGFALSAATAERDGGPTAAPAGQFEGGMQGEPRAGRAQRVADGDGAAVQVRLVAGIAEILQRLDRDRAEAPR